MTYISVDPGLVLAIDNLARNIGKLAAALTPPEPQATLSNSWKTTQTHTECVDCEAAVEMAIQHATNLRLLSSKWTISTPYSEMPSLAVEHVGTADRS